MQRLDGDSKNERMRHPTGNPQLIPLQNLVRFKHCILQPSNMNYFIIKSTPERGVKTRPFGKLAYKIISAHKYIKK